MYPGVSSLAFRSGVYGRSKFMAFRLLDENRGRPLTQRQIAFFACVSYPTLSRLPLWWYWQYVGRYHVPVGVAGDSTYRYKLLSKGRRWLHLAIAYLPAAPRFEAELAFWHKETASLRDEFMVMNVAEFVPRLDSLIREFRERHSLL